MSRIALVTPARGRARVRVDERGSATLFATATIGVLLLLGAALGVVAALVAAHRTAQSAADLAALGGASSLQQRADPCSAAARVADANGAALDDCSVAGEEVTVTVRVAGPRWLGQSADLTAQGRAGPVR